MIKKDVAYDFMSKKEKASDEQAKPKTFAKTTTTIEEDPLISKINKPPSKSKMSSERVENIRKTESKIIFDVITKDSDIIKDLSIPTEHIYSQKNQLVQERMMETEEKHKKMIEFFIIYPAAILSSVIIIHALVTMLPVVQQILHRYF